MKGIYRREKIDCNRLFSVLREDDSNVELMKLTTLEPNSENEWKGVIDEEK